MVNVIRFGSLLVHSWSVFGGAVGTTVICCTAIKIRTG